MRGLLAIALASACPLFLAARSQSRIAIADVELSGPFEGATLDAGTAGRTRIEGRLLDGETRILRVPVPVRSQTLRVPPRIHLDGDGGALDAENGRAMFVGWRDDAAVESGLPATLRARSRPPLEWTAPRPTAASLAILAAGFLLGLSLLRRPIAALAVSAVCATCASVLRVRTDEGAVRRTTVFEGAADSDAWLEVEAGRERMRIAGAEMVHVESEPHDARILCDVALENAGEWEVRAPRAVLYRLSPFSPGARSIALAGNAWSDLAAAWTREGGEWSAHGEWTLGTPIPPPIHAPPPPGWLLSGLPQGTDVLIARVRGSVSAREAEANPIYLRVSGL
jgi:hypothetical protein